MQLTFGKYKERSIEWLVLNDPNYVLWMLRNIKPDWKLKPAFDHMHDLIDIFDSKPFVKKCSNQGCKKQATESYVFSHSFNLHFRCKKCGALISESGMFKQIETYRHAVSRPWYSVINKSEIKDKIKKLIRSLAHAKGLPDERMGKKQLRAFFGA